MIPGKIFLDTWREALLGNFNYFVINFLGNIMMFMPLGFFPPLLWRRVTRKKAMLAGAGFSLTVELCQLLTSRGTDIDDLWLNALGVLLGFYLYQGTARYFGRFTERFRVPGDNVDRRSTLDDIK